MTSAFLAYDLLYIGGFYISYLKKTFVSQGILRGGHVCQCSGTIQPEEGGIQVLAGLAPTSQTEGSFSELFINKRSITAFITTTLITVILLSDIMLTVPFYLMLC
jgi:hypothetical protein